MASPDPTRRDVEVSLPLWMRLKAWWHGYDLQATRRLKELEVGHDVSFEAELEPWEKAEYLVPQLIWGEGFLTPGGAERVAELVKPLALDKSMSVLDVGGHLGGQARLIARDFGAWVTAVEADTQLAEVAGLLSEREGLGKKAEFHSFKPDSVEFRNNAFDVAISTDALYRVESKRALLIAVGKALKKRAQFMLSDYIRDESVADTSALDAWIKIEPSAVHLWTETEYRACFKGLKLDARVVSDVSVQLRSTIVAGFADYLNEAAKSGVEDRLQEALVNEVERWLRFVAALDSGALKAVRIHALRG